MIPTLLAVSNVDGVTPVVVYADPVTHRLLVAGATSGSGIAALMTTDTYATTAGQTTFTLSAVALFIFAVVINGQPQTPTADYTYDDNLTVTLTIPGGVPAGLNAYITYIHA